jgi:hypothetical protein
LQALEDRATGRVGQGFLLLHRMDRRSGMRR